VIGGDFDQRTTAAGASADRVGIERAGDQVVFGGVSASLVSQCRSSHPFSISFLPLVNSSLCFLTNKFRRGGGLPNDFPKPNPVATPKNIKKKADPAVACNVWLGSFRQKYERLSYRPF